MRNFLEAEVKKRKRRQLEKYADELGEFFSGLSHTEVVESIRQMRRQR